MTAETIEQITPQSGDILNYGDVVAISDEAARYPGRFAFIIGTVYSDDQAIALDVIGPKDGLEGDHVITQGLLTKLTAKDIHQVPSGVSLIEHLPERGQRVVMIEDEDTSHSRFIGKIVTIGNVTGFPRYFDDGHIKADEERVLGRAIFKWAEFPESMGEGIVDDEPEQEYVPVEGDRVIARRPNITIGGGPDYTGEFMSSSVQGDQTWYMVKGDFNRYGINFREVVKVDDTTEPEYVPSVDDYVRFTGHLSDTGIVDLYEDHGVVTAVEGDIWTIHADNGEVRISGPGYVFPADRPVVVPTVDWESMHAESAAAVAQLTSERDVLTRALADANGRLATRNTEFESSMTIIGERFWREAKDRGWCSEAQTVVEEINEELPVYKIPERKQEFTSYVDVSGNLVASIPVVIEATSQEEADDEARGMSLSEVDSNLAKRGQDSIDAQLTNLASRRSFELELIEE